MYNAYCAFISRGTSDTNVSQLPLWSEFFSVLVHVHCRDFKIFSSHGLLPSDLVAQSVERRRSNPNFVGSFPTLAEIFLSLCGPISISRPNAHLVHMG